MCTLIAVIGLLDLTSNILTYYAVRIEEVCTYDTGKIYYTGVAFFSISFAIGLACLW
jgi:hypothetical protein